jgi:hypothetical protein
MFSNEADKSLWLVHSHMEELSIYRSCKLLIKGTGLAPIEFYQAAKRMPFMLVKEDEILFTSNLAGKREMQ